MQKLVLNKETLVALTAEHIAVVQGAMPPETWTDDGCGVQTRGCHVTDFPCNSVDTCDPQCQGNCKGTMSKP